MDTSVIVVGAGPAGLALAGELRLGGVDVVVVERLPERTGESRGLGFTARTMELFDQRGLLPRFGAIETSPQGHFGGLPVDFSVLSDAGYGVKGVSQARTETILEGWAVELGAEIWRGHELVALDDDGERVTARITGPSGERMLRASYLVGCDGGRSTVRKLAGFDFPGTAPTREMFLADVRGCAIEPRPIGETVPNGMVMSAPLGDGVDRIIVCERGALPRRRTEPPSFAEVAAGWRRLTGQDISHGDPVWVSAFGDPARQVTRYRLGRVLLAGDAAHVHLPAGGQGMNVSIQDAINLGWKLAATVRGIAPPELLDTYHTERHPVGARLLMNAQAQGMLFLSGEEMQPIRGVLRELIGYETVTRHLAGMVSGLDVRYATGAGDHPLLGLRLPPSPLVRDDAKTGTAELLRSGRGLLLDLTGDAALRAGTARWADRVDVVTATPHDDAADGPLADTRAVLVRPDGHVVWTAPGSDDGLRTALERWFGPAATWIPKDTDVLTPSAARAYDAILGGRRNFEADRRLAAQVLTVLPARDMATENRRFLRRSVEFMVGEGITQFLDLGSGLPVMGNVHEIAQGLDPRCRVVYVDNEEAAATHGTALLGDSTTAAFIKADIRDPEAVLNAAATRELLDLSKPVGLLMLGVTQFLHDADRPWEMSERFRAALAPGSLLVLSSFTWDNDPKAMRNTIAMFKRGGRSPIVPRTRDEVLRHFGDFELVDPGLVALPDWRPDSGAPAGPGASNVYAGMARKPGGKGHR
jgi:bifunctional hydroxylase/dehydrase